MERQNKHGVHLLRGRIARGIYAASLLFVPFAATQLSCSAQPSAQAGRPQFQNNQQPHLGTWLQRHGNMPPDQQEKALQREPGFSRLNPETQQQLLFRLQQINRMPPAQRQHMVDRIEAMERLNPQGRQQVRASVQEFRTLPQDRQRLMKKAFRDLREYPPEQRQAMIDSSRFQEEFSPRERGILSNLLEVEPYHPLNAPGLSNGLQDGR